MKLAFACLVSLALASSVEAQTVFAGRIGPGRPATPGGCPPRPLPFETYDREVDLDGLIGCNADFAGPWTVAFAPGGAFAYASLFATGFDGANCLVAKLDARTLEVVSHFSVGLSPQEFAFTEASDGGLRHGFVTNSTSSTVTVFDAADTVVTTIDIPFDPADPFQTAFPFGIATSPDGSRVYVGTLDGSGDIHVIDAHTLVLLPAETIAFGAEHGAGRLAFHGSTLVVPLTEFDPNFTGSSAKLGFVDPAAPRQASTLTLASAFDVGLFPSAQDVAFGCGGRAFVAGFDMGTEVFVVDVPTRAMLGTIPTHTSQVNGKFQGIGISPEGLLAVADFLTGEIAFLDSWTESWIRTTDHGTSGLHRQFMECTFRPNGRELLVPCLSTDNLAVLDLF